MVGLDIACNNIKIAELRKKGSRLLVKKAVYLEREAELINPGFTNRNILSREALRKQIIYAYSEAGIRDSEVCVSIPASCVRLFFLNFEELSANREEMVKLIKWQIDKQMPGRNFKSSLSYQVINPEASGGYRIMAAAASEAVVDEYVSLLYESSKNPVRIEADFLAAYNYFEDYLKTSLDYLFVYSSFDTTSLLFFQAGEPVFYHRIDMGGRDYSMAISLQKKLDIIETERYKQGKVFFPDRHSTDPEIMENFALIKGVNEKLFKKINDSIRYFLNNHPRSSIDQVFICGNGLAFANLDLFGENFWEIKCELLNADLIKIESAPDLSRIYPAVGVAAGGLPA